MLIFFNRCRLTTMKWVNILSFSIFQTQIKNIKYKRMMALSLHFSYLCSAL